MPTELYPTHSQLTDHMKQLGFEVSEKGMCYGLTHAAISAIHLGPKGVQSFNARSKKIKQEIKNNTASDNIDFMSFYNTVYLYQNGGFHPEITGASSTTFQSYENVQHLVIPTSLHEKGQRSRLHEFMNFFTMTSFYHHLLDIQRVCKTHRIRPAIEVGVDKHVICIGYEPKTDSWYLFDNINIVIQPVGLLKLLELMTLALPTHIKTKSSVLGFLFNLRFFVHKNYVQPNLGHAELTNVIDTMSEQATEDFTDLDDEFAKEAFQFALLYDRENILEQLLQQHPFLKNQSYKGFTPLNLAILKGLEHTVVQLIKLDVDLEEASKGLTPVQNAIISGQINCLTRLLNKGADPDKSLDQKPPLIEAIFLGNELAINALIEARCDININWNGQTPLYLAAQKGLFKSVQLLVNKGTDLTLLYSDVLASPIYAAAMNNHGDVVEYLHDLIEAGPSCTAGILAEKSFFNSSAPTSQIEGLEEDFQPMLR